MSTPREDAAIGQRIRFRARKYGDALTGIGVIADLLSDAAIQADDPDGTGEPPAWLSGYRQAALLRTVRVMADDLYSNLVQAVGDEHLFIYQAAADQAPEASE